MGSFNEAYRHLNAAQKKAVDAIDGPLLVIAGPGTGKTQLLSLRVANILRRTDAHPENILCLTYTESGQRAMQTRLLEIIGEPAKKIEIHTFHGFGTYLIAKYEEYFPHITGYRPADDLALYEVLADSFAGLDYDSPLAKRAYGQWFYLKDVAERISQCKQAGLTPEMVAKRVANDQQWCETVGRQLTEVFQTSGRLSVKQMSSLTNALRAYITKEYSEDTLAGVCLNSLAEALNEADSSGKTASLSAWKRQWLTSEEGSLYFKPADQLVKLADFAKIYKSYEARLVERKLFDYDNMLLFALEGLRSNAELRSTVQENFQYILADEYQDTNKAQAEVIELIAENPVNEGRPNVMVVGDDDQAIYGFQGAMGEAMLTFRQRWRDVEVVTLTDNYRSTQPILNTARQVISQGRQRLENYYEDINKELSAVRAGSSAPKRFATPEPAATLHFAAKVIQTVAKRQDIAVIASKHKYLSELAAQLDERGITYFYEGRDDLLSDQEVNRMLLIAGAALAVKQTNTSRLNYILPELITYSFTGLTKSTGWQIAVAAQTDRIGWWAALRSSADAACQTLVLTLENLANTLDSDDALAALSMIGRELPGNEAAAISEQKLTALVAHAISYSQREVLSLGEVLAYVSRCREAGIRLDTKVEAGQRGAGIRLMTAHKSKGLEFDSVYVLHADEYTWFREKGRRNNVVLPPNWHYIQPATETFDDRLRLLYVVLTRAKHELLLISSKQGRGEQPSKALPGTENITEVPADIGDVGQIKESNYDRSWQAWYWPVTQKEKQQLKNILSPRLNHYRLSPSHLTGFLDVPRGGPLHFLVHNLLGILEPVSPEALYGSRVHACLRFMQVYLNEHGRQPSKARLRAFIIEEIDEDISDKDRDRLIKTVTRYQSATKSLIRGSLTEYSFSESRLKLGAARVTGTIDRLHKAEQELEIVDYKTGRPLKSWRSSDDYQRQKLHRYRQQLLFYQLLCRLSPEFNAREIKSRLEFVEPAKRGGYVNLVLDADAEEARRLEALIAVIWRRITELDLPDARPYKADIRGISDFEDDLLSE